MNSITQLEYNALCSEENCFSVVRESDIERGVLGVVYERSKKCWGHRTKQDKEAIKRFRKETRNKLN